MFDKVSIILKSMQMKEAVIKARQIVWELVPVLITRWLKGQSGPVIIAISSWAQTALSALTMEFAVFVLIWVGLHTTQLFSTLHGNRIMAPNPLAISQVKIFFLCN